ncbi:dephospho-CoA kinase [Brevirhabdus pacifica]|nr:dephospho-CoA kinase [Brevirhabdus pacifica]
MGKSTTAGLFAAEGVPVWDADAAVHRLYGPGGAAVAPLARICPDAIVEDATGQAIVDRQRLKDWIARDDAALPRIEAIVHPLVGADRAAFLDEAARAGADIVVLDIPLIFETGAADRFDTLVVVSAPAEVQRARVLARGTMTEAEFENILARQVPDAEKRRRADHVIPTTTLEAAAAAVRQILEQIRGNRDA